jgi:hypothetical protein
MEREEGGGEAACLSLPGLVPANTRGGLGPGGDTVGAGVLLGTALQHVLTSAGVQALWATKEDEVQVANSVRWTRQKIPKEALGIAAGLVHFNVETWMTVGKKGFSGRCWGVKVSGVSGNSALVICNTILGPAPV